MKSSCGIADQNICISGFGCCHGIIDNRCRTFCIRKCAYCDFVSGPGTKAMQKEYEEALLAEIDAAEEAAEREVITVFFGGGTPSAVDAGMLARVMEKLRSKYVFSEDAEITLEANPGTLDVEKLKCYRKSGFNRSQNGTPRMHYRL